MISSRQLSPGGIVDREAPLRDAVELYAAFQAREVVKAILRP
jgi:threonine dehydrogenase-like Zn-dependent dehydrogenase